MALVPSTDLDRLRDPLTAWLRDRWTEAADTAVTGIDVPGSAGFSNETLMVEVTGTVAGTERTLQLVVRLQQSGPGLFPSYRLDQQWDILEALHRDGVVPVPRPLWREDDPGVLGAPFYAMERVQGRAALDDPPYTAAGWFIDLEPGDRTTVILNGLDTMARVHATDLDRYDLSSLRRPGIGDPLDREIAYYEQFYAWAAQGRLHPTVEGALTWIREHRPTDSEPVVLCWGDARPANLLVREDLSVAAVLDWEMATLASPLLDLGWWVFMQRHHTDGYGIPAPHGLPDRDKTIAHYRRVSGHDTTAIDYYEAFAALRGAIIMLRLATMMIESGILPDDADLLYNNPGSRILAELTGQPPPAGAGLTGHIGRG
jgi:aminoglycoside phosphotransferase (APT) family kinase protein